MSQQFTRPLHQELQAEGLPSVAIDHVTSAFQACVHDHASENDSTVQPESCQRLASDSQVSHQAYATVLQVTDQANAQNYANAFAVSAWYNCCNVREIPQSTKYR